MRLNLLSLLVFSFTTTTLAAPTSTDDCESLKSLSFLKGAQIFCAQNYPATEAPAAVADKPKTNAKRFKADDERVVRVLGNMPEVRQKAFCACYPAVAA